jgi:hypothetical protein
VEGPASASAEEESSAAIESDAMLLATIEKIPSEPKVAVQELMAASNDYAKGWLAYLAFLGHVEGVPAGPGATVDAWMAELPGPEKPTAAEDGHYPTLESLLFDMRFAMTPPDYVVPCWLFEAHPDVAFKVFGPYWGDSWDHHPRFCRLPFQEGPEIRKVYAAFRALSNEFLRSQSTWTRDPSEVPSCGTIRISHARGTLMGLLRFALFPTDSMGDTPATLDRRYRLETWAAEDTTGHRAQLFADVARAQAALRPEVVAWFQSRGHDEEQADRMADNWLELQKDLDYTEDKLCLGECQGEMSPSCP